MVSLPKEIHQLVLKEMNRLRLEPSVTGNDRMIKCELTGVGSKFLVWGKPVIVIAQDEKTVSFKDVDGDDIPMAMPVYAFFDEAQPL